ncbi:restriction endonuclease subunit S [Brevibacillus ginsengisoli]|uniref:restriction endonuclease subunit S n=1 Tax=Brevibacillus ginsengisoli TaxID=363854 RepID=UPI003CEEB0C4
MKWSRVRLGDAHTIVTGSTPSRINGAYYGEGIPFVKPQDLEQGRRLVDAAEHLSEAGKQRARVVGAHATLLSCIGTIGKSAYSCVPVTTNQQINSLIPGEVVYPPFTYYYTRSPFFQRMLRESSTITTIAIVNKSKLSNLPFPLPPLKEQKAVVRWIEQSLDQLQLVKQLLRESTNLLTQCRLAILHQLYPTSLEKVPSGWRLATLGELVRESRIGLVRSTAMQSEHYRCGYMKMNNITSSGELDLTDLKRVEATEQEIADYQLRKGDLVINTRNSWELVGKSAVYFGQAEYPLLFNNNLMRMRFQDGVDSRYIQGFFYSNSGNSQLQRMKSATTNVAAIYSKHLFRMKVLLPPLEVQLQVVNDWEQLTQYHQKGLMCIPEAGELEEVEKAILGEAFAGFSVN